MDTCERRICCAAYVVAGNRKTSCNVKEQGSFTSHAPVTQHCLFNYTEWRYPCIYANEPLASIDLNSNIHRKIGIVKRIEWDSGLNSCGLVSIE